MVGIFANNLRRRRGSHQNKPPDFSIFAEAWTNPTSVSDTQAAINFLVSISLANLKCRRVGQRFLGESAFRHTSPAPSGRLQRVQIEVICVANMKNIASSLPSFRERNVSQHHPMLSIGPTVWTQKLVRAIRALMANPHLRNQGQRFCFHMRIIVGGLYSPVSQLQQDVFKVFGEGTAKQAANVLENERFWSNCANNSRCLWKHIPRIVETSMFPTNGKWLTRRTAGNQFHLVGKHREIKITDIRFVKRPPRMSFSCLPKVESNCGASISVALNDNGMIEPSLLDAQAKSARSGKKFN